MELEGRHVGVLGLGLMGGSIAGGLVAWGNCGSVSAWDDEATLKKGLSMGLISRAASSVEDLVSGSEILILALPVDRMVPVSMEIVGFGGHLEAVLDLSSVRGRIHFELGKIWGGVHLGFHPMAGKEKAGVANASPDLLEGAVVALIAGEETGASPLTLARRMAVVLGARPLEMGTEEHDEIVAWTSHLPMVMATALSLGAGEAMERLPRLSLMAAGGFRDSTRVASGPPWLLASVLKHNERLGTAMDRLMEILVGMRSGGVDEMLDKAALGALRREAIVERGSGRSI